MLSFLAAVLTVMIFLLILLMLLGFYFFKSSKEMPKSWHEWKTEFRVQSVGITGLVQDYILKHRDHVDLYKQPGRIAVITGGNRGIGLRIVEKLLECEMIVIMGVRDPKEAEKNVSEILDLHNINGKLIFEELDVGSLSSIKKFGTKVQHNFDKVDIILNNAGIMFAPFEITKDGFESHFVVNYLGHFLLTHLLMPQLKRAGKEGQNSRVVNVSSIVNLVGRINYDDINGRKGYYPAAAYNQSKLAQILFTKHLDKMMQEEGAHVQVHAVHPGVVDTDLFVHSSTTAVPGLKKLFFKNPEEGSRSVVYAAIAPKIEGKGGTYISNCVKARTHPIAKCPEKCEELFDFSCKLLGIRKFGTGEL